MKSEESIEILEAVKFILDNKDYSDRVEEAINMAIETLKEQRPHGEWVEKCWNDPRFVDYECSVCKRSIMNGRPNFCPNCGADMRQKEGGERGDKNE